MNSSQNNIFSFIKENDNNKLLELSKDDLQLLLILIDDYKISLRKKLDLKNNITFGMEIEIDKIDSNRMEELEKSLPNDEWKIVNDLSIPNGKEIRTAPLKDTEKNWQDLDRICKILSNIGTITDKCGGHIHLGTQILDDDIKAWKNLFLIWSAYENIIYRFGYGEFLNARVKINEYAPPIAQEVLDARAFDKNAYNEYFMNGLISIFTTERYQGLNLKNVSFKNKNTYKNTIEMRYHNGTSNHIIMQNNANFDAKLIKYSVSDLFDEDTISRRMLINKDELSNLRRYEEIDLIGALELADLIFDNNLDKINFLKQYLKDMRETRIKNSLVPAKRLTKR